MKNWDDILQGNRIIPVLVIDDANDAVPLAETLCEAGLPILEITLRTDAAQEAIKAICDTVDQAVVGVGTVIQESQFGDSITNGAKFFVSPGHTSSLINAAKARNVAYLPGAQTLSEMMYLREAGIQMQKFFPAELNGGPKVLKAAYSVLPDVRFCPTGGITEDNAEEYLNLPNIACIGGSWIAPQNLIKDKNWAEISRRAKLASQLG